jgi:hypothetical protein
MLMMKKHIKDITFNEVAQHFKMNHATVIHGIMAITNDCETNKQTRIKRNIINFKIIQKKDKIQKHHYDLWYEIGIRKGYLKERICLV